MLYHRARNARFRFTQVTENEMQQSLYRTVKEVDSLAHLYLDLSNIAPNELSKANLQYLYEEELIILENYKKLYNKYFGILPSYDIIL